MGSGHTIIHMPCHIIRDIISRIYIVNGVCASTGSELPFCFGRKAESLPSELIEFANKGLAVFPADILHRIGWIRGEGTWVITHDCLPQGLCHLCLSHIEIGNRYLVDRYLIIIHILTLFFGSAHDECTSFHFHHCERNIFYMEGVCLRI